MCTRASADAGPIPDLTVNSSPRGTTVSLTITAPAAKHCNSSVYAYTIQRVASRASNVITPTIEFVTEDNPVVVDNLDPFNEYSIDLAHWCGGNVHLLRRVTNFLVGCESDEHWPLFIIILTD